MVNEVSFLALSRGAQPRTSKGPGGASSPQCGQIIIGSLALSRRDSHIESALMTLIAIPKKATAAGTMSTCPQTSPRDKGP